MSRWPFCVAAFGIMAAVVGAQDHTPADPREQAALFGDNKALMGQLIDSSLDVSDERDPVERVKSGHTVLTALVAELKEADDRGDLGRVEELGEHLGSLVGDGVIPALKTGRELIAPGSREDKDLLQQGENVSASLSWIEDRLRRRHPEAPSPELEALLKKLRSARGGISSALKSDR